MEFEYQDLYTNQYWRLRIGFKTEFKTTNQCVLRQISHNANRRPKKRSCVVISLYLYAIDIAHDMLSGANAGSHTEHETKKTINEDIKNTL